MSPIDHMIDLQKRADEISLRLRQSGDHEAAAVIVEMRQSAYRHWSDLNRIATIAKGG